MRQLFSPFVNSPIFILPYSHITFPAHRRLLRLDLHEAGVDAILLDELGLDLALRKRATPRLPRNLRPSTFKKLPVTACNVFATTGHGIVVQGKDIAGDRLFSRIVTINGKNTNTNETVLPLRGNRIGQS